MADCSCYRCTLADALAEPLPDNEKIAGVVDPRLNRMFLCATCGNKRCPRAADHRLACSGSNEPGQKGSLYENAPRRLTEASPLGAEPGATRIDGGRDEQITQPSHDDEGLIERLKGAADLYKDTVAPGTARLLLQAANTISRLKGELEDAIDRAEELERDAEIVSSEFEKDCWIAVRSLLERVGHRDFSEGVTANDACDIIYKAIREGEKRSLQLEAEIKELREALAPFADICVGRESLGDATEIEIRRTAESLEYSVGPNVNRARLFMLEFRKARSLLTKGEVEDGFGSARASRDAAVFPGRPDSPRSDEGEG